MNAHSHEGRDAASIVTPEDRAALLEPAVRESFLSPYMRRRLLKLQGELAQGRNPTDVLAQLDSLAFELARDASEEPEGSDARARRDLVAVVAQSAADSLRLGTLPTEGEGSALVPFVREAIEQRLLGPRAILERLARQLDDGAIAAPAARAGLAAVIECVRPASEGAGRRTAVIDLLARAFAALEGR